MPLWQSQIEIIPWFFSFAAMAEVKILHLEVLGPIPESQHS